MTDWGDCLPECPTGAISFEEREAPEYDEAAVKEAQKKIFAKNQAITAHAGCPGSKSMQIQRSEIPKSEKTSSTTGQVSNLQNWPVQIKLAPVNAPYFNGSSFNSQLIVLLTLMPPFIRILFETR